MLPVCKEETQLCGAESSLIVRAVETGLIGFRVRRVYVLSPWHFGSLHKVKLTILAFILFWTSLFLQAVQGVWDSSSLEEPRGTSQHGINSGEFASVMAAAL